MQSTIAIIGFGEAGSTFARSAGWGQQACAFDILPTRERLMAELGIRAAASPAAALAGASLVLSLVTADQALRAAQECAAAIPDGLLWCDMNSVAPETKRAAARTIEEAGARFVDVAVLAPVEPAGLAVSLLLSGPAAPDAETALRNAGFLNVRVVGNAVGQASAIKMIRSVMVKGIEALTDEMIAAARAAGVESEVLASLDASDKPQPWATRAAYNIERMATHGKRRAAEMEESVATLQSFGVEPIMTRGTVLRQRRAASGNPAT
ncbi:NAD(P)-dependent oxidoreductase [Aquisediminimonas profunda]|uniref:NAD(P)-dependent oxidoreductase n=1 Tax=Aquisediminimonas profunda TaxID=1550733 RepID=UPI001C63535C|nr:NAD(P)-dependent oxidoreductase [Aquisediminimonas profunda]